MKNLRTIAIMAGIAVFTLSSCGEEDQVTPTHADNSKTVNQKSTGGGGEEEEPIIIYGLTQTSTGEPLENADVTLYDAATNLVVNTTGTNANGNFEFSELEGTYYLLIEASGYLTLQSSDLNFPDSNGMTFILQNE